MKKRIIGTILAAMLFVGWSQVVAADYQDEWGPAVGSELPELSLKDVEGKDRTLEDLIGDEEGIVLFFVRTSDW